MMTIWDISYQGNSQNSKLRLCICLSNDKQTFFLYLPIIRILSGCSLDGPLNAVGAAKRAECRFYQRLKSRLCQNSNGQSPRNPAGRYQLDQKTTMVDWVSNRPLSCDLYTSPSLQDPDRLSQKSERGEGNLPENEDKLWTLETDGKIDRSAAEVDI